MSLGPLSASERLAWHRLAQSENVGPVTFHQLLAKFPTASAALEAIPELSRKGGLRRALRIYDQGRAEADLANAEKIGARYIASCEPDYPPLLREAPAPPPLICVKGRADILRGNLIAIVGTRNASAISMRFTRQIATELAGAGFVIVSGLARGIDTAAHQAALATGTIAVVAGGVDHIYPPENKTLQESIGETGLIVSEMPPGTVPKAESFPRRNRIIAGLARATLIMEAALRSGSLTTARFANEAGREVFAVPGSPLDPRCDGTNGLIKDGAHMLTNIRDVLDEMAVPHRAPMPGLAEGPKPAPGEASDELRAKLYALLSPTPTPFEDLLRESAASAEEVQGILIELELAGEATRLPGGRYARL